MFKKLVINPWFAWFDLVCVIASLILLEVNPTLGGWPLVIALIPWLLRLTAGQFPFLSSWLAFPLFVFLLTAGFGVWASYDPQTAQRKLWLLAGAVFLFFALAGQPKRNIWTLAGLAGLFGIGVAVYFTLTNNWNQEPAEIGFLNRVGLWWMAFRPKIALPGISHNFAAGMIAWSIPFVIVLAGRFENEKKKWMLALAVMGGLMLCIGFALAFARGTALALGGGLAVWITWLAGGKFLAKVVGRQRKIVSGLSAGAILLVLVIVILLIFSSPFLDVASTSTEAASRLDLANSALELSGDFPFTGSGLATYPGLFSTYIRNIPFFFMDNSYNQYLDVLLEQGLPGFLAFFLVYLSAFWLLLTKKPETSQVPIWMGTVISLAIVCIHGLADRSFYSIPGSPLAFLAPAMACSVASSLPESKTFDSPGRGILAWIGWAAKRGKVSFILAFTLGIILVGGVIFNWSFLRSAWEANLGAVKMAKVELADFPSGTWKVKANQVELHFIKTSFLEALVSNPQNRTANHRLGLIAMNDMEYEKATGYLEAAFIADPNHRGIIKALGYSYAWIGDIEKAIELLKRIPEAKQEMEVYTWWWGTQGREDLVQKAKTILDRLGN